MKKVENWSFKSISLASALALAVPIAFTPTPSQAGSKGAIIGLGIGAIIGAGIASMSNKRARTRTRSRRSVRNKEVRKIQTALAELGYYTKRIDGIGGRGTRAAVSQFQIDRGFVSTGRLDANQKLVLFASLNNGNIYADPVPVRPVYRNPGYVNSNGGVYANGNPNGEVDVFGNRTQGQASLRRPNGEATIFDNTAPVGAQPRQQFRQPPVYSNNGVQQRQPFSQQPVYNNNAPRQVPQQRQPYGQQPVYSNNQPAPTFQRQPATTFSNQAPVAIQPAPVQQNTPAPSPSVNSNELASVFGSPPKANVPQNKVPTSN